MQKKNKTNKNMSLLCLLCTMYLSAIVVSGDGGVCAEFQRNNVSWSCFQNISVACESIINGIFYPKLCRSTPCKLEGKVNNLLVAGLGDFALNVISVILMITAYFGKCAPGQQRCEEMRFIKLTVFSADIVARIMAMYFSWDLIQASQSVYHTGCTDDTNSDGYAYFSSRVEEELDWFMLLTGVVRFSFFVVYFFLEEAYRPRLARATHRYQRLTEVVDPNADPGYIEQHVKKHCFPMGFLFYFVTLHLLICVDLIITVCMSWTLFNAVVYVGRILADTKKQPGSYWCFHCSDGRHRGGFDQDTYTTDVIRLGWILTALGLSVAFLFAIFSAVIGKHAYAKVASARYRI